MEVIPMALATAEEIYEQVVKPLPAAEQLRVATLILNRFPLQSVVVVPFEWEEEDEETEMAAWRALSARVNSQVWDNPADNEAWDNWEPPKQPRRKMRGGKAK
jgi:hypothetical protein